MSLDLDGAGGLLVLVSELSCLGPKYLAPVQLATIMRTTKARRAASFALNLSPPFLKQLIGAACSRLAVSTV